MAEYYHIYGFDRVPPLLLYTLVFGLREGSRVSMAISGMRVNTETILLAKTVDSLNFLAWCKTKDAEKNANRPSSILEALLHPEKQEKETTSFNSSEEFEKERERILKLKGE